jgi:hypothetical protein
MASRQNATKSTGQTPKKAARNPQPTAPVTASRLTPPLSLKTIRPSDALKAKLLKQCLSEGELELQIFERYVFALLQVDRARQMEIDAQARWINEPNSEILFTQMECLLKLGAAQERRADKALKEFTKLQRDRILVMDFHTEVYLLDNTLDIAATFPMFEVRKTDLNKTTAGLLPLKLMALMPEAREIVDKHREAKLASALVNNCVNLESPAGDHQSVDIQSSQDQ